MFHAKNRAVWPHFIQSVPYAIGNLRELLKEEYPEYPYLCKVLRELTGLKQFTDDLKKRQLTVKVMSFAYKKGIPDGQRSGALSTAE